MPANLIPFRFHDDVLDVVHDNAGNVLVGVRAVCAALELDYSTQLAKLKEKPWATVGPCPMVAEDGKTRDVACIGLRAFPMWLATIDVRRVAEHARPKLAVYQRECADVLADHFLGQRVTQERRVAELRAHLEAAVLAAVQAAVPAAVRAALSERDNLGGLIGAGRAERLILAELRSIADMSADRGTKPWRAAHRKAQNDLRDACNIGSRHAWRDLPERHLGDIRSHVALLRLKAERDSRSRMPLFDKH